VEVKESKKSGRMEGKEEEEKVLTIR